MADESYNPTTKSPRQSILKHAARNYGKLRSFAAHKIANEKHRYEFEAAGLVHDIYIQLAEGATLKDDSEAYFVSVASKKMALFLIDSARTRKAWKNGGRMTRVSMDNADIPGDDYMESQLILSDAFTRLEQINGDQAAVAELMTFGKLTITEAAHALNMTLGTAKKHWKGAVEWFRREVYSDNHAA